MPQGAAQSRGLNQASLLNPIPPPTPLHCAQTTSAGVCKVLLHPSWGADVYPASLFTSAPLADIQAAVEDADRALLADPAPPPPLAGDGLAPRSEGAAAVST